MSNSGIAKKCEKGIDEEEDCEVSDQLSCLSSEEEYEAPAASLSISANDIIGSKRKRKLTEDGDQTTADSKKQSCLQHNENERKRRKSMKYAVHTLREQLTKKTRKPAVNTVLLAAYDEIQDLKQDEREKEDILEKLKNRNIVLKYLLEKEINELKQQSPLRVITCSSSSSSDVIISNNNPPPPVPPAVPIYVPSPRPTDHRESHHGISWQGQKRSVSSSPPPPPPSLPPPPPLISTKIISSPTYISSPPPRILPPPPTPPPLPSAPSSIVSPSARFITYPVSPAADRSNHFSPIICSPPPSFFPFVPLPTQSLTMPPIYYPAPPPNAAFLQLSASTGFPIASTKHLEFAALTPNQAATIPVLKEENTSKYKPIQLQNPLQKNRHKESKHPGLINHCKNQKQNSAAHQMSSVAASADKMDHVHHGQTMEQSSSLSSPITCSYTRPISVITDNQSYKTDYHNPPITNSP